MISKVMRGADAYGLINYLFSEPTNDHSNARLVASWDGRPEHWEPARLPSGGRDCSILATALHEKLWAAPPVRMPFGAEDMRKDLDIQKPVYHIAVALQRADPESGIPADPHISDAQFAEIIEDLTRRVGLHDAPDVRYVGIRHDSPGETHAHLVVTRPGGGFVDYVKLGDGCQAWEARLGLRRTASRDGTGPKYPTRAETEKAKRREWPKPTRTVLKERVAAVAGVSEGTEDFFRRLRDEGLLVKTRLSPTTGMPTGYSVAIDRPAKHDPTERVWFSGGKLAPDLTLPKVRARWNGNGEEGLPHTGPAQTVDREKVWAQAVSAAREATPAVNAFQSDPQCASAAAWAASDFMASSSRLIGGREGRQLREAAAGFERAGYAGMPSVPAQSKAGSGLRSAGRLLLVAGFIPSEDAKRVLLLAAQLAVLADAIARMREAQDRPHQARGAQHAADALRALEGPRSAPYEVPSGYQRIQDITRSRGMTL